MHSKNSGTFAVIVSGSVTASLFQLLDPSGNIVLELNSDVLGILPITVFDFYHLDPLYEDSRLSWSQGASVPGSGEQIMLRGPKLDAAIGSAPSLTLYAGSGGLFDQQGLELHSGIRDAPDPTAGDSVIALVSATAGPGKTGIYLSTVLDIEFQVGTTGRLRLGAFGLSRPAWLPLGCVQTLQTANLALLPGFNFLPGIGQNLVMEIGDMVIIDLTCDMQVPASGFVGVCGGTIQNPDLTFSNPPNGINYNLTASTGRITGHTTYVFTATQQGNHNLNAGAFSAVGGYIAIATHSVLRVQHWGIR